MVNATALNRPSPAIYVIEDAHWIDSVSEALLADFLAGVPQTSTVVVVPYRPKYPGALAHGPRSQTLALEPLDDSQMSELSADLLGRDSSVAGRAALRAKRAEGTPL